MGKIQVIGGEKVDYETKSIPFAKMNKEAKADGVLYAKNKK